MTANEKFESIEDYLIYVREHTSEALTPHWPNTDADPSSAAAYRNVRLMNGDLEDYLQECLAEHAEPDEMIQELLAALACKHVEGVILKEKIRALSDENEYLELELAERTEGNRGHEDDTW